MAAVTDVAEHPPVYRRFSLWYWLTTTDHKDIGKMYLTSAFTFLLLAGSAAMLMRAQLMYPDNTVLVGDAYNHVMSFHGTAMIFMVVIPALTGLGNFIVPIMVGARDMAFPRLNNLGFWVIPPAGLLMLASLMVPGGGAQAGWTGYPPLSQTMSSPGRGMDMWILSMHLAGASSIMGGLNFIVTILNMRHKDMTLWKMPLFVWTWLITSWLQVLATPVLAGALTMLLFDRNFGTAFFRPELGGDPIMWQHVFWTYSHPAVYIMILSAFGVVSQIIPTFSRKPLFGYLGMVYATAAIGILAFVVWGHHMFAVGMPTNLQMWFMFATWLIAIPTGVKIFSWVATMWEGDLHFMTPMLFAIGFVAFFLIGGLDGIYCAIVPLDIQVHDTYFVVSHLHYVVFAGSLVAILGAMYYWFPKMSGRMYNETLGKWHFWITMIAMNVTFWPMHNLGLMGMPRRVFTYMPQYAGINFLISCSAFVLGAAQLLFFYNIISSLKHGEPAGDNPWHASGKWLTFEWQTSSPPPKENFTKEPIVTN